MKKKKEKEERNILIIFWCSFIVINLIGYLMNIDMLKTVIIRENGHTLHFVSLFSSLLISIIYHIIYRLVSKRKRK